MVFNRRAGVTNTHIAYVAGRYRDGVWSDHWTDVSRCADHTFTNYAPACLCGWRGPAHAATRAGHLTCQRMWVFEHVTELRPCSVRVTAASDEAAAIRTEAPVRS